MRAKLGDTIEFSYSAPGINDSNPVVYFLARVGKLIHGLNQHYQSPQEKYYYYLMLKNVLYDKLQTGKIDAQTFYRLYVRNRLVTNSYRTYRYDKMNKIKVVPNAWAVMTGSKVDSRAHRQKYMPFKKGDHVRFVSMIKGKLSWTKATVLGKKPPGAKYVVQTSDGRLVDRHPADLRLDNPIS